MTELSNPFSTGSGGSTFESKVQASFVVAMLVGGRAPLFPDSKIKKIKLQGKFNGFDTDDVIVFIEDESGNERKLLGQIKHEASFTESSQTLGEVLSAAWSDFQNQQLFNRDKDKLALITGPLSKIDINSVRTLLDWAKHSESANDFATRVAKKNYSSNEKRTKLGVIKFHLAKAKGSEVTDEELWQFCKTWNVFGYDLDSESSVLQASILSLINLSKTNASEPADSIWRKIISYTTTANQNAGVISDDTIDSEIKNCFSQKSLSFDDIVRIREHGDLILKRIDDHIGECHLDRTDLKNQIIGKAADSQFLLVSGVAGSGKSAIVLNTVKALAGEVVFYLRTEDLNHSHIDAAFTAIGVRSRLSQLTEQFSLIPRKFLVIESLEKLLELDHTEAVLDLFKLLEKDPSWKIIGTCRTYSVSQLTSFCLAPAKIFPTHVEVENLSNAELAQVVSKVPSLKSLVENPKTRDFLRNPFFLGISHKIAGSISGEISIEKIKEAIWTDVIGKSAERRDGLPLKRVKAFVEISVRRARQMQLAVGIEDIDSEAVLKLERDGLITRFGAESFAPAHDLLEDWAIERFVSNHFSANESNPERFFELIGSGLAFRRTFRHWFQALMLDKSKETNLRTFVMNALSSNTPRHWKDELITCILMSESAYTYLNDLSKELIDKEQDLLKRFCFILRTTCKEPDHETMKSFGLRADMSSLLGARFLKPSGPGWMALIKVIRTNCSGLDGKFIRHITPLLKDWVSLIRVDSANIDQMREAGLVSIHFLNFLKDSYRNDHLKDLVEVLIKTYPGIHKEVDALLEEGLFQNQKRRNPQYIESFCEEVLTTFNGGFLCHFDSELVVRVAWATWKDETEEDDRHSLDIPKYFGLHEPHTKTNFNNASAFKGPFWVLLKVNAKLAIDFIIDLTNYAAHKYSQSSLSEDEDFEIELNFDDGAKVEQICSSRLWNAYVATSVTPGMVNCALMALEKWLIEKAERGESIEADVDYILRNSKSVFTTSMIAGIANGYWNRMGKSILPILRCKEVFSLDIARMVSYQSSGALDFFGMEFYDPTADIHKKEREQARSYKWRKSHLENVVRHLLFSEIQEDVHRILDAYYAKLPPESQQNDGDRIWRIALGRMDMRRYSISEDKEKKMIIFNPPAPPEDIRKLQEESGQEFQQQNRFMTLNLWGTQKYQRELTEDKYYPSWKEALQEAKWVYDQLEAEPGNEMTRLFSGGLFYTAAFCVRDHLEEMSPADIEWTANLFIGLVSETADTWLHRHTLGESGFAGFHAAAFCLPKLFASNLVPAALKDSIKEAIAKGMTHPDYSIQMGTAQGVRDYLWKCDPAFANACLAGSVAFSKAHIDLIPKFRKANYGNTPQEKQQNFEEIKKQFNEIRAGISNASIRFSIKDFSFKGYSTWDLKAAVSLIPEKDPSENCIALLQSSLRLFLKSESERDRDRHERVDHNFELVFEGKLGKVILENGVVFCQKHFGAEFIAIDKSPEFGAAIIKKVLYSDINYFLNGHAWALWDYFAGLFTSQVIAESKKPWDSIDWSKLDHLPRALLFNTAEWKNRDFENQLIGSGKGRIIGFFSKAGSHPAVFDAFVKLCYHFPAFFLPDALPSICSFVIADKERKLFKPVNTKYYLEQIIIRFVIGNFRSLKGNPSLGNSLLGLLDCLVDEGSSVAYFLRERVVSIV